MPISAACDWPACTRVREHDARRGRAAADSAARSAVTTAISSSSSDVPERAEHVARTSPARAPGGRRRRATRRGAALRRRSSLLEGSRASSRRVRTGRREPTGCRCTDAAKSSTSRASRARASGGVHQRVRHERRRSAGRLVGHDRRRSRPRRRARCRPRCARCRPARRTRSVGPLSARPPTNGLTATTGAGAAAQRLAHPGQGEDRADRDHRVRRADHDRVGLGDRLRAPRRRAARARARAARRSSIGPSRALDDHELLERQLAAAAPSPRSPPARRVIGSTRASTPSASTTAACASVSAAPRAQQLGADQAHGQVAVAEPEPVRPAGRARARP